MLRRSVPDAWVATGSSIGIILQHARHTAHGNDPTAGGMMDA
jgi:hypothetical protein